LVSGEEILALVMADDEQEGAGFIDIAESSAYYENASKSPHG
jgi:hypothetical protein